MAALPQIQVLSDLENGYLSGPLHRMIAPWGELAWKRDGDRGPFAP